MAHNASSFVKFLKMLDFLEEPRTVKEIVEHMQTEESTIYRYLRDFESFGKVKQIARQRDVSDTRGRKRLVNVWVKL